MSDKTQTQHLHNTPPQKRIFNAAVVGLYGLALAISYKYTSPATSAPELFFTLLLFLYLGLIARSLKFLTLSGALAAVLLGTQLSGIAEFNLLPLLIFFGTGSLFTRLNLKKNSTSPDLSGRNAIQIFANSAPYWLIALYAQKFPHAELLYLISVAVACSDTWASELGFFFRGATFDIVRWKRVNPGLSGGVSVLGTISALAGSFLISLFAVGNISMIWILISGFLGSLSDSILGSAFQARYQTDSGTLTDEKTGTLVSGWKWVTNDVINLISNILITAVAALLIS